MPGADARLDVFTDGLERRLTNLNEFEPVARRGIEMMVVTVDRLTVLDCPCRPGYPRQRALLVFGQTRRDRRGNLYPAKSRPDQKIEATVLWMRKHGA